MPVPSAVPSFPVRRHTLTDWLRTFVDEHRTIIRLVVARENAALATYFREVHWSYERNQRYITDAFDREGEAAVLVLKRLDPSARAAAAGSRRCARCKQGGPTCLPAVVSRR